MSRKPKIGRKPKKKKAVSSKKLQEVRQMVDFNAVREAAAVLSGRTTALNSDLATLFGVNETLVHLWAVGRGDMPLHIPKMAKVIIKYANHIRVKRSAAQAELDEIREESLKEG